MTTDTADLYVRQFQREIDQGEEAQRRLISADRAAHERAYASSSVYGQKLLKTHVLAVSEHLSTTLKRLGRGRGAVDAATVYNRLCNEKPEVIALITMKVCLDVLGKNQAPSLIELTKAIGSAIETELRLKWYKSQDKDLFDRVTQYFHSSTGSKQKATVYKLQFNREGLTWPTWGSTVCHKVGAWCLDGLITCTGWIRKETVRTSKYKTKTQFRYSPDFLAMRDEIMSQALTLAFCKWPMLCPPMDWSNDERGGYLTEAIRQQGPMIRRAGFGKTLRQGDIPITFLNRLQAVPYRINNAVLDVANALYERSYCVGSFIRMAHIDPPPRPGEGADEDAIKEYKRRRRDIEDHNAQLEQKNWRTTETLYVANRYANEERWWLPVSFDYRGRCYFQTGFNPQGTDFDKSLIYFADEGPIDEGWLAWHVATTAGHDKLSHESRRAWTREHIEEITAIATEPLSNISLWEDAGEPFCYLAACIEYYECCIAKTKACSGLGCGLDATCSGIQHLASLTLDRTAAVQVNVVKGDTDEPSDGYRTVAVKSLEYIEDEETHSFIDRKTTKRACMTLPYGCSKSSARTYIRAALKEKGMDLSVPGRLASIVTAIYDKAIREVFAGPCEVMDWLQQAAKDILKTRDSITWKTPSGFVVVQDLRKSKAKRIQTTLLGSVVACFVGDGWGDPDVKHHVGAIAPNLIHSLDASLLQLCFAYWDKPFTVIHDCVLVRSCDMEQVAADIRLHHAEIYKGLPLEDWAEQVGVTIPDGLMKNDLNMDDVLSSPYFFC